MKAISLRILFELFLIDPIQLLQERKNFYKDTESIISLKVRDRKVLFSLLRSYLLLHGTTFNYLESKEVNYEEEWSEIKLKLMKGITLFINNLLLQNY